jgi:heme exporter protein B
VLIVPLTIPVLIFGVAAGAAAAGGALPFASPLKFLAALTLAALVLGPVAAAAAIRQIRD